MPVRESYTSIEGHHYPLWIDINDVIKTPDYKNER